LETIEFLKRKHYAPKSEQVSSKQLGLFNEAEETLEIESDEVDDPEEETITYTRKKPRNRISKDLPREEVIVDLSDEEKVCSVHGCALDCIGEEVSERVKHIPAQTKVIQEKRLKYSCPCCSGNIVTAPAPKRLLPGSMATASLLAAIIVSKFMDHLPLYRQEKIFARIGFLVTRATATYPYLQSITR
jgi:transposase